VLVRAVPYVSETSFYTRHGDVFAYGCCAVAFSLLAGTWSRRLAPGRASSS